ncbi:hypothetical protein [Desulfosporosinus hippei]|uniref:ABC-2 family transporter protein n=1 Tax=Desulfosporosinus hippei DSM 8344 TaxID=1121419 RepID=A0A1G8LQY0_9FIRM|nr:hypothetical protein [Desulfosporosinus hippei]SDI58121.1 hypothetical protein SAMN05443529_1536 [Desulfosporosinus hippei DSM 8344]
MHTSVTILLFWFLLNGYFLNKLLKNINDKRLGYLLDSPITYIHDKVLNANFAVFIIFPLFLFTINLMMEYLFNNNIMIRYNKLNIWVKDYYKSSFIIIVLYVILLNLLVIILSLYFGLAPKLFNKDFIGYLLKFLYFQICGFLVITNLFTITLIKTKNTLISYFIITGFFIFLHFTFNYLQLIGLNIPTFEMFMFLNGSWGIFNYIWFILLLIISHFTLKNFLSENDFMYD